MPTIRVIEEAEATGRLKEICEGVRARRGGVADILKAHSLLPETLQTHLDFSIAVQSGKNSSEGLTRAEREMIAVVVSAENGCAYCIAHPADALDRYGRDAERVARLAKDPEAAGLSPRESALCRFARDLTRSPGASNAADVERLKSAGLPDEAVLQATLTTAYFNFVNRVALAMGLDPAADVAKPYSY